MSQNARLEPEVPADLIRLVRTSGLIYGILAIVSGVALFLEGAFGVFALAIGFLFSMLDDSGKSGRAWSNPKVQTRVALVIALLPIGFVVFLWGIRVLFRRRSGVIGMLFSVLAAAPMFWLATLPMDLLREINLPIGIAVAFALVAWIAANVTVARFSQRDTAA